MIMRTFCSVTIIIIINIITYNYYIISSIVIFNIIQFIIIFLLFVQYLLLLYHMYYCHRYYLSFSSKYTKLNIILLATNTKNEDKIYLNTFSILWYYLVFQNFRKSFAGSVQDSLFVCFASLRIIKYNNFKTLCLGKYIINNCDWK